MAKLGQRSSLFHQGSAWLQVSGCQGLPLPLRLVLTRVDK